LSEYQYYEFLAVDEPLDVQAQAEVRELSTRARIDATSFVNEYHWGDFRGDPRQLVERYYDAHLYCANWGTRRVMLRLPRALLDLDVAEQYRVGDQVAAWTAGEHLILDMTSEDEPDAWDYEPEESLSGLVGVRTELAAGDHRALYLAWLAGYGSWERDEDAFDPDEETELEPPVPPGLRALTAPQRALAEFLRLDDDLLAVAAQESRPLDSRQLDRTSDDPARLATWVTQLPAAEKDRLLVRVVQNHATAVRTELLRRFRAAETAPLVAGQPRRTVADLLDNAALRRADRRRGETQNEARREHVIQGGKR